MHARMKWLVHIWPMREAPLSLGLWLLVSYRYYNIPFICTFLQHPYIHVVRNSQEVIHLLNHYQRELGLLELWPSKYVSIQKLVYSPPRMIKRICEARRLYRSVSGKSAKLATRHIKYWNIKDTLISSCYIIAISNWTIFNAMTHTFK